MCVCVCVSQNLWGGALGFPLYPRLTTTTTTVTTTVTTTNTTSSNKQLTTTIMLLTNKNASDQFTYSLTLILGGTRVYVGGNKT